MCIGVSFGIKEYELSAVIIEEQEEVNKMISRIKTTPLLLLKPFSILEGVITCFN
jgi:hypothetical protein